MLRVVGGVLEVVDSAALQAVPSHDLSSDSDKAGTLKRNDLGEAGTHRIGDVTRPRGVGLAILGDRLRPDWRPAGNVHIDILLVFVVTEEGLSVLPAIEASNAHIRELAAGGDSLETLALAIAVVGAFDVGGLNLAAVVNNDAVLVDKGLRKTTWSAIPNHGKGVLKQDSKLVPGRCRACLCIARCSRGQRRHRPP